jgi:hypothetical protein
VFYVAGGLIGLAVFVAIFAWFTEKKFDVLHERIKALESRALIVLRLKKPDDKDKTN